MGTADHWRLDATSQAALVRSGEVAPTAMVETAIHRISTLDDSINSVVTTLFDRVDPTQIMRDIERGAPFAGVPALLKDAGQELEGTPYGVGLKALHDIGHRSSRTTPFVEHLEDLGFVIIGKAASSELATGNTTEPPGLAPTRNPWDTNRTVGGSSGGSGASVAAGLVPVAHGSDHTGSLRYPAAACGAVTLKPTKGSVVSTGVGDIVTTFAANTDFVVTRSVRDLADVLGTDIPAPHPMRIRLLDLETPDHRHLDPSCRAGVERAGTLAAQLGHEVDTVSLPELDVLAEIMDDFAIVTGWLRAQTKRWLEGQLGRQLRAGDVPDDIMEVALAGRGITTAEADEAGRRIVNRLDPFVRRMSTFDVLVTPTLIQPAWPLGRTKSARNSGAYPVASSITGQPAMSIPLHHNTDLDLPIGVHLVGRHNRDAELLGFAAELEAADPWIGRWPPAAIP